MRGAEDPARHLLRVGLGALWALDALLQAQPALWTRAVLVGQVWRPAAQGPAWLVDLMFWAIGIASPHIIVFNAALVATQAALAALLLAGPGRTARIGGWGTAAFAAAVWLFGQGLGGLLAPGASLAFGAPGSGLLYGIMGGLLLVPAPGVGASTALAALLAGGALLQTQPAFWNGVGLSAPIAANFMLTPPALRAPLDAATAAAMAAPRVVDALLTGALLAAAAAAALRPAGRTVPAAICALLTLLWVMGEDVGLLWTGMATDPNTMPALAVLALAGFAGAAQDGGARPPHAPAVRGPGRASRPGATGAAMAGPHRIAGPAPRHTPAGGGPP